MRSKEPRGAVQSSGSKSAPSRRMCSSLPIIVALILLGPWHVLPSIALGQRDKGVRVVIPGEQYKAGWFHELLFGAHWRTAWTTPVEVEVLDLETFAGGLKPVRRGGGMQTKSLRLRGADGKQYKFRSLDKDPTKILPKELRNTFAASIMQDQISSANPYAQFVVVPIMNAVGILNAEPMLVILPDDERLGDFREEFGGLLGTIEEHPDEAEDGQRGFAGADKIIGTFTLFEKMEEDNDHVVDETEFLKARLVDIYLGDWDRHTDQWRWAGFKSGRRWTWKPVPRDRDQAFARFDGVLPWMADVGVAQLNHFTDYYPKMEDLSWTGRFLDRRLLSRLTKATWDSLVGHLQSKITIDLIKQSVRRMPPELYALEGHELERMLIARILQLPVAASEYYRFVNKYADVRASDKDEFARIDRIDDQHLELSLFDRDKESGQPTGAPFYNRMFTTDETKEVRLYLLDGDDQAIVTGNVSCNIEIHVDGGEGKDELIDESDVTGPLFGFIPVKTSRTMTYFYDSGKKSTFSKGPGTVIDRSERKEPATELERWEPSVRDYGHDWRFGPWLNYTPDDGLFIGGGPILYEFGFRKEPYIYRMDLRLGYATKLDRLRLQYTGEFYNLFSNARLYVEATASGIEVLNYYGLGNETSITQPEEYYKIQQRQVIINPSVDFFAAPSVNLSFGFSFKHAATNLSSNTLLGVTRPYGVDDISLVSLTTRITVDTRDKELYPQDGLFLQAQGSLFPGTWNNTYTFGQLVGDARAYIYSESLAQSTLAVRLYGTKVFGTYPFFEAAYIGGASNLRGFEKQRFGGDASLVGSGELRVPLGRFILLVPARLGVLLFAESGRVFLKGESSRRWHGSVGGGLWFSFVRRDYTASFSVARSHELTGFYLSLGFGY